MNRCLQLRTMDVDLAVGVGSAQSPYVSDLLRRWIVSHG
jgi:hypothetical protein